MRDNKSIFSFFLYFKTFFFACSPLYVGIGLHSCWHVPSGVHDSGDFYFCLFKLFPFSLYIPTCSDRGRKKKWFMLFNPNPLSILNFPCCFYTPIINLMNSFVYTLRPIVCVVSDGPWVVVRTTNTDPDFRKHYGVNHRTDT